MNNDNQNSGSNPVPTPAPLFNPATAKATPAGQGLHTAILLLVVIILCVSGAALFLNLGNQKKIADVSTGFKTFKDNNAAANDTNFDKVEKDNYQAVFLESGQVYFGNITAISNSQITLEHIYYLRSSNGVTKDNVNNPTGDNSLVKLGCELHGPKDIMYIERKETSFWENLKQDGQVTKAIKDYVKQNPNGQKCQAS